MVQGLGLAVVSPPARRRPAPRLRHGLHRAHRARLSAAARRSRAVAVSAPVHRGNAVGARDIEVPAVRINPALGASLKVRFAPKATESSRGSKMPRWANRVLMQCSNNLAIRALRGREAEYSAVNLLRPEATNAWEINDKTPRPGANHHIMHRHFRLRRAVVLGAVATASLLAIGPARAQVRGAVATPVAQSAPSSATPAAATPAAPHSAACTVAADQ